MKKLGVVAAIVAAISLVGATSASAQKLYWTASGTFGPFNIQGLIPSYSDAKDIKIPINMWILDHPMGLVVYDTGNNVAISDGNCTSHWSQGACDFLAPSQVRSDVIDKKLEALGYTIDDVKIVITSRDTSADRASTMARTRCTRVASPGGFFGTMGSGSLRRTSRTLSVRQR